MKILIGVLAHQLNSETVKRVFQQEWDDPAGLDVLFCWGNDMRPDENRFEAVTRKYQELQKKFLAGPYDALLTCEQDMLLPPDALSKLAGLISDGADVAMGLYVWRYIEQLWWNAHPKVANDDQGVPWFWSMSQFPEDARRLWGQPVLVDGLGFGCTLISRHALTRISFRMGHPDHCCDTTFALDCQEEGLIQIADLGVVCGHMLDQKRVVYPDPEQPNLYRIEQEI
jgi:hypothetical protein